MRGLVQWRLYNNGDDRDRGSSRIDEGDVAMLGEEMARARKLAGDKAHMGKDCM